MIQIFKYVLAVFSFSFIFVGIASAQQVRNIKADLRVIKGPRSQVYNECVGAGRANEGLRADWQKQLAEVQKDIGFRYIRFHGLLHDDMGVYTENSKGDPVYNWQYVDELFDYLQECHIRPFVELSFMPSALKQNNKTVFWWKANVTSPVSYAKWAELITQLLRHFEVRYGVKEVEQWPFEIWNEPNHPAFSVGSMNDYFMLYDVTVKAVKSLNPGYKVGGPATAGTAWITEMINHCYQNNIPIDFISTHDYGVVGAGFDEFGVKMQSLRKNPNSIAQKIDSVKRLILRSKLPETALHITEWSSSYSSKDPVHDSYQNATFVLNTLKNTELTANSMSYWVFTDVFEEAGPPARPFEGGFGLINLQGIKKPTYYAYQYLRQLGSTELVNLDKQSWICKDKKGEITALIYDYTYPNEGTEANQSYFRKDHPAADKGTINLELSHIPNGYYRMQLFETGYKENDPFTMYLHMGLPASLSQNQLSVLQHLSSGLPVTSQTMHVVNNNLKKQLLIRENDILFVRLTKF